MEERDIIFSLALSLFFLDGRSGLVSFCSVIIVFLVVCEKEVYYIHSVLFADMGDGGGDKVYREIVRDSHNRSFYSFCYIWMIS